MTAPAEPRWLSDALTSGLSGCARCGHDHTEPLPWKRFEHPVQLDAGGAYEYWAPCPTNGDPIMLFVGPGTGL